MIRSMHFQVATLFASTSSTSGVNQISYHDLAIHCTVTIVFNQHASSPNSRFKITVRSMSSYSDQNIGALQTEKAAVSSQKN